MVDGIMERRMFAHAMEECLVNGENKEEPNNTERRELPFGEAPKKRIETGRRVLTL